MSERSLLDAIQARSAGLSLRGADLAAGPGDDCAVVHLGGETLLVTVDQVVEGRHFETGTPLDLIARKAVARSISDIAAMAGEPIWSTGTGVLPDGFAEGDALFESMKAWAERWHAPLIGGDIAFGPGPLVLTVTVVGRCPGAPILRSGAQPGDVVSVSGPVGGSLASGRHLSFEPAIDAALAAGEAGCRALIDVSDGLGIDADRVARASGVRLEIDAERVPLHNDAGDWRDAVAAGEDYVLLAAGPGVPAGFVPIGTVCEGLAGASFRADGVSHGAGALGWDHGREQDGPA